MIKMLSKQSWLVLFTLLSATAFLFTACSDDEDGNAQRLVGYWQITDETTVYYDSDGEPYDTNVWTPSGTIIYEFRADGTFINHNPWIDETAKWWLDGNTLWLDYGDGDVESEQINFVSDNEFQEICTSVRDDGSIEIISTTTFIRVSEAAIE